MQILCPNALNMIVEVLHLICQATGSDTSVIMNMFLLFKTIEGILLLCAACPYYVSLIWQTSCIVSTFRLSNVLVLELDS